MVLKDQIYIGGGLLLEVLIDLISELDIIDVVIYIDVFNFYVIFLDLNLRNVEDLIGT